jgi:hypothetical protein
MVVLVFFIRSDGMIKRVSFVLSLILIFTCCSAIAEASYEESLSFDTCFESSFIVDVKTKKIESNASKYYYQYDTSKYSIGYNCYDYLDEAQKYVYDAVVANAGSLSFTINFPNNLFAYSNFTDAYLEEIMNAICIDRPDIFYYAGQKITGGTLYSNGEYLKTLNYVVGVYDSTYYTNTNVSGYYNALINAMKSVPVDLSNRYNFIKSVHDYLADTVYYPDLNTSDYVKSAHDAYGALVEGRAVCQGYSDAVKLICDYYHIPCVCISGKSDGYGHMWNAIQMDDGKWYLMDLTWDDQDSWLFYDFFLVGTQSTNTNFGGKQFSAEHVNDCDLLLPLPILDYSTTAYNRNQNHYSGFNSTYNCATDEEKNNLCISVFDAGKSNIYYNGIYVDVNVFENGAVFTAPSGTGSTNESWTLYLLADVNSDGVCDSLDYSASVNLAIDSDEIVDSTQEICCDVNLDGYVDALDVLVIARASSGLNTNI